jgi:hypothetical protein
LEFSLDRRDQILAKLAVGLGLVDQAGVQRAVKMVSLSGQPFEQVLVEARMITPAGYKQLADTFNHYLQQANAQEAARQRAATRPAVAAPPSEDEILGQPTLVLDDSVDEEPDLAIPDEDLLDEEDILDQNTMVLTDEDEDVEPLGRPPVILTDSGEFGPLDLTGGDSDEHDSILSQPTVVLSDALMDEDDLLAQPTMVLQDDAAPTRAQRPPREAVSAGPPVVMTDSSDELVVPSEFLAAMNEDDILAQPTMVLDDSCAELSVPTEEELLAQPTVVMGDDSGVGDIYAEPTMVLADDALTLASESSSRHKRPRMPTPGVKSKKNDGPLNREELQRRLKMRLGFGGFTVGDYRILHEIARGAFGVVLEVEAQGMTGNLAKQRGYSGNMALKVALENKTDPRETERFITETRLQISFDHPHIVRIFDCGVENGLTYYSMEKIEGMEARKHVLKHGPMPPLLAARICKETALALAYVHARRIYHRDLKPQNILLDTAQKPYRAVLIDFGLVVETDSSKDKGLIVGTPSYMPPEQAKPRGGFGQINVTSDIYSLGATLFFLLTGRAPFTGRDPRKIIKLVVGTPPPDPCALNPAIPRGLADLVLKCLAKKQSERYHSAKLLASDLEKHIRTGKMKLKAKGLLGRFGLGRKK